MIIYSLKSKSLGYFNQPFYAENDMTAMNVLRNACIAGNDPGLIVNLNDLILCKVGEFDSASGIKSIKVKEVIDCAEIPLIAEFAKEVIAKNENIQSLEA